MSSLCNVFFLLTVHKINKIKREIPVPLDIKRKPFSVKAAFIDYPENGRNCIISISRVSAKVYWSFFQYNKLQKQAFKKKIRHVLVEILNKENCYLNVHIVTDPSGIPVVFIREVSVLPCQRTGKPLSGFLPFFLLDVR